MADTVENREADLRELNANLEKRVADRTAALTKANALARESVRLKSEFMSTMSHELRTPLNAILGFSGIMLQGMGGEMDDDAMHMIERIDSNSQRLLKLINDILDLAKIEAGRMELANTGFSPRELVKKWEAETGVLAEKKALQFGVSVAANLPDTLYGDPERVTQMAVNLLSNAFKFTDRGEVSLYVFAEPSNHTWNIRVSDTGMGIPPHALNYIFDEFRQVDGSSKRVYGGTGLGLAIVRNMCRMMNGTINVASELGKGSQFTITLPMQTQPEGQLFETA
jgi:signal transduction histidine kinase